MPEKTLDTNTIVKELQALKTEIGKIGQFTIPMAKDHGDWSAHGKWSSGSKALLGDFDLTTKIGQPTSKAQLDQIIMEASSSRFLEVAKSLQSMIGEK